jgi:transposase
MAYSDMFKRKMIQRLSGPDAISAQALSNQVDVPQTTLSKWLRNAGIKPSFGFPKKTDDTLLMRYPVTKKSPNDWSPEEKLKIVLEADALSDDQIGEFIRRKGIHETHLQQWRLQMLDGLGKQTKGKKKSNKAETKQIRKLEKELLRKDKALAETAALLVLKKKVQEIWGDEDENTTWKNGK